MNALYLSSFCVAFRDYDRLRQLMRACGAYRVGAELATSWTYEDFQSRLDAQVGLFSDSAITLHAPFVEICGAPGSEEADNMERAFQKAFAWYDAFHARTMVMHTHEKKILPERKDELQRNAILAIRKTAATAKTLGAALTVENVGYPLKGNVLFNQQEFVHLFDDLPPQVGALIDIGHAMANGWDIPKLIETLGKRIRAYHLHNTDGIHDLHRPIYEEGLCYTPTQMDALLRCIAQNTPEADLILEYAPGPQISETLFTTELERLCTAMNL